MKFQVKPLWLTSYDVFLVRVTVSKICSFCSFKFEFLNVLDIFVLTLKVATSKRSRKKSSFKSYSMLLKVCAFCGLVNGERL